jgi:stage II sporulation protein D
VIRSLFLKSLGAATTVATGGLDVWDPGRPQIRVLIAGDVHDAFPQVDPDGTFLYGGRRWRGAPSTVRLPSGATALVTTLDVDAYLQGVVPLETPSSWPAAALAAQAIVARTFALGRRTLSRAWDVAAADSDQQWGGVDVETAPATAAVQATRGRTLSYAGGPAAVFYSACCGGHTADAAAAWGGAPLPYLRGVVDPYCTAAPDYRWSRTVALERASDAFRARVGGPLRGTALTAPDDTGRPRGVMLLGNVVATVPLPDFRRTLGYDTVRSLWLRTVRIDATQADPRLVIEGCGHGHGVGLCQWGAKFFAASGASPEAILAFYFPGTSVSDG